jgi:hypothetical protein
VPAHLSDFFIGGEMKDMNYRFKSGKYQFCSVQEIIHFDPAYIYNLIIQDVMKFNRTVKQRTYEKMNNIKENKFIE